MQKMAIEARRIIIACVRKQDPEIGDDAMISETEWGYWADSIYVSKSEVAQSDKQMKNHERD